MRLAILPFLTLSLTAAACGPNLADVARARNAQYHADPQVLFQGAIAATEGQHYKIREADPNVDVFITLDKVFSAEGETEGVGFGDSIQARDRSIVLTFVVRVVPAGDHGYAVTLEPQVRRMFLDRSNLDDVAMDDPTMPGWVKTRIDELSVAIHDQLAGYEVTPP